MYNVKNRDCITSTLEGLLPLLAVDEFFFFLNNMTVSRIKSRSLFVALVHCHSSSPG